MPTVPFAITYALANVLLTMSVEFPTAMNRAFKGGFDGTAAAPYHSPTGPGVFDQQLVDPVLVGVSTLAVEQVLYQNNATKSVEGDANEVGLDM